MTRAERFAALKEERNRKVLLAAIQDARDVGYSNLKREAVARRAGVATGSVTHAYGSMRGLRDAVMAAAVRLELVDIVAQGLADGHEIARNADPQLKERARASLV